jgi:hypothetical protein
MKNVHLMASFLNIFLQEFDSEDFQSDSGRPEEGWGEILPPSV